jgi:hypothetical protein
MSSRFLRSALALTPVLALLYLACSKADAPPVSGEPGGNAGRAGSAGGAGTNVSAQGGTAGSSGTGISGGQGGQSGKGGSGQAGMGGAAGGQGNVVPEWKEIGKIQGYPVAQLQNPSSFQAFVWKPCDWTNVPGCEQAFFNEEFFMWKSTTNVFASAHDDGEKTRGVLIVYRNEEQTAAIVQENGAVIDAFVNKDENFSFTISDSWGENYGINGREKNKTNSGAIIGQAGKSVHLFDWDNSGSIKGSLILWASMGKSYFTTQWMSMGAQSYSLVEQTQSRFVDIEKLNPDALGIEDLTSAGDQFLYTNYKYTTYSTPQTMISDGENPGIPYTNPPLNAADGSIEYANSHVAWYRGFNQKATNHYESVELWASEFSPDPQKLKPFKVSNLPGIENTVSNWAFHGGWGKVAYIQYEVAGPGNFQNIRVRVSDLKTLKNRDLPCPPNEYPRFIHGVTRSHVWFVTDGFDNAPRQLYRWKIDSVPIVP